jgi:sortase A
MTALETRPAPAPGLAPMPGEPSSGVADEHIERVVRLLWTNSTLDDGPADLATWASRQPDPDRAIGQLVIFAGAQLAGSPESHLDEARLWTPRLPAATVVTGVRACPTEIPGATGERTGTTRDRSRTVNQARPPARAFGMATVGLPAPIRPLTDPEGLPASRVRVARAFLWLEVIGALIILFAVYQLWGTSFEQQRAQAHLRAAFLKGSSSTAAAGAGDAATVTGRAPATRAETGSMSRLPGGAVARIEIPAINVDQFVVEGTGEGDLRRGPGHYIGSPLPGQPGNAAIAGHRTTYGAPFSRLDELRPGDTIITTTTAGRFVYVLSHELIVSPGQTSVVDDYGDSRLTLTTCTPKFLATQRLIAVAILRGPAPAAATPSRTSPPGAIASKPVVAAGAAAASLRREDRGLNLAALPTALLVAAIMIGLGLLYRPIRRRLPPVAALVVVAPFWMFAVLILFEQLTRVLPPNV